MVRDKVDSIMERRLGHLLDSQLIEAYLKLDTDQLASRKVSGLFSKVVSLYPSFEVGKKFCRTKSLVFDCSVGRFCAIRFNNCILDVHFV
jgi:hypothetical protein